MITLVDIVENGMTYLNHVVLWGSFSLFLELLISAAALISQEKKRPYWPLRLLGSVIVGFALYFLPSIRYTFISPSDLIALAYLLLVIWFVMDMKLFTSLFYAISAFALQHISWNLMIIIIDILPGGMDLSQAWHLVIFFSCYFVCYFTAFLIVRHMNFHMNKNKRYYGSFIISTLIIIIVEIMASMIGNLDRWTIFYRGLTALCSLFALIIQFGYPHLINTLENENNAKNETAVLENMLDQQSRQQQLTQETINIINMKSHDLKHQIRELKKISGKELEDNLEEIEKNVNIYGNISKTGNEALDIILTDKGLLCESRHIRFTYIIDAKCLNRLSVMDLTSLFGNILDNAIEASTKENEDFRIIKMQVKEANNCIYIEETNFSHSQIEMVNGLPKSDKGDDTQHGYGTKSIKYIAQKYGGNATFIKENDVFRLEVLIPLLSKTEN